LTVTQVYDRAYLDVRYAGIDGRVRQLAAQRAAVMDAFIAPVFPRGAFLDFGCGTGHVVRQAAALGWDARGHDLCLYAADILFCFEPWGRPWDVVAFFDSLEHLADQAGTIRDLDAEWVMVSVPNCARPDDWRWLSQWRHLRPGEHLWHWGRPTLARFFRQLGYREVMVSHFEDEYRPNPDQPEPNILTAIYRRE
jgi:hypothetical protein